MALGFVRPAHPGDAAEIALIQLSTWRHAYRRILPHHVLGGLDADWMARRWRTSIEAAPSPRHRVLVAIEEAARSYLVGFIATGPADTDVLSPGEREQTILGPHVASITDLLVQPRWGRRGHGSRLLAAASDGWRADGVTSALAWTFEADIASGRFLSSAGWAPDGVSRALDVDDLLVPQIRHHTRLI